MKYAYVVRLKPDGQKPEEYYFEEYKDSQSFMQRCGGLDADFIMLSAGPFDNIKVQSDCLYENVLDTE